MRVPADDELLTRICTVVETDYKIHDDLVDWDMLSNYIVGSQLLCRHATLLILVILTQPAARTELTSSEEQKRRFPRAMSYRKESF